MRLLYHVSLLLAFSCCHLATSQELVDTYSSLIKKGEGDRADSVLQIIASAREESSLYRCQYAQALGLKAFYSGEYQAAKISFLEAADCYGTIDSIYRKAAALNNAAITFYFQDSLFMAYQIHQKVLGVRQNINDPKISSTYNNLGLISMNLQKYREAITFFNQAIMKKKEAGDFSSLSNTYNNLGITYRYLEKFDSAHYFYRQALSAALEHEQQRMKDNALNNISYLFFLEKKTDSAVFYIRKSIESKEVLSNQKSQLRSYAMLGRLYVENNEVKKGLNLADSLISVALEDEAANLYELEVLYTLKLEGHLANQNYEEALKAEEQKNQYHLDYVKNQQNSALDSLKAAFELSKKTQQIDSLAFENKLNQEIAQKEKSRFQNALIILVVSILSLIFILFFFLQNRRIKKRVEAKNLELANVNKMQEQLLGILSHDIRNSLYSSSELYQLIMQHWEKLDRDELKQYIETLRTNADNVNTTLNDIIGWISSRLNSEEQLKSIQYVLIVFKEKMSNQLKLHNLHLEFDVKSPGHLVYASAIEVILRNLTSNTIQHSPSLQKVRLHDEITAHHYTLYYQELDKPWRDEELKQINDALSGVSNSLGITLIKTVTESLNGSVRYYNQNGHAICAIKLPIT